MKSLPKRIIKKLGYLKTGLTYVGLKKNHVTAESMAASLEYFMTATQMAFLLATVKMQKNIIIFPRGKYCVAELRQVFFFISFKNFSYIGGKI